MKKPVVYISGYNGRDGNHMFQFAWAKASALELDYDLCVPAVGVGTQETTGSFFPLTHGHLNNPPTDYVYIGPDGEKPYWHTNEHTNLEEFKKLHYGKNLRGNTYFQNYQNFKKHKNEIKKCFALPYNKKGKDCTGIHLRLTDFPQEWRTPTYYHYDCIERANPKKLLIFTDEPTHQTVIDLNNRVKDSEIIHQDMYQDMALMASCDKLILSKSTYSWWSGFLGVAEEIFFPAVKRGWFSLETGNRFWVDDENRYIKVKAD